jgi:hypothetical protein
MVQMKTHFGMPYGEVPLRRQRPVIASVVEPEARFGRSSCILHMDKLGNLHASRSAIFQEMARPNTVSRIPHFAWSPRGSLRDIAVRWWFLDAREQRRDTGIAADK